MASTLAATLAAAALGPVTDESGRVTWDPPAQYDFKYPGNLEVQQVNQRLVQQLCDALFATQGLNIATTPNQKGCAVYDGNGNGKIIAIDAPFMGIQPEDVIRHEMGHLNGWPSDHTGGQE